MLDFKEIFEVFFLVDTFKTLLNCYPNETIETVVSLSLASKFGSVASRPSLVGPQAICKRSDQSGNDRKGNNKIVEQKTVFSADTHLGLHSIQTKTLIKIQISFCPKMLAILLISHVLTV